MKSRPCAGFFRCDVGEALQVVVLHWMRMRTDSHIARAEIYSSCGALNPSPAHYPPHSLQRPVSHEQRPIEGPGEQVKDMVAQFAGTVIDNDFIQANGNEDRVACRA